MLQDVALDLKKFGFEAAREVAGVESVENVDVVDGEDSLGRPAYHFSFLIDAHRARQRMGLVFTRLIQKLADELIARGDSHMPTVQILDREDWPKRSRG